MYDIALIGGRAYIPDGGTMFTSANIYVEGDRIALVSNEIHEAREVVDCSGKMVLPGLIDPHVHLDLDLGAFKTADDFESGSMAALAGGITTIIDFLDPISDISQYEKALEKRMADAETSMCDYSFHVTLGDYRSDVEELVRKAKEDGIPSVKIFTTYSDSGRMISLQKAKELLACDILMLAHCEDEDMLSEPGEIPEYESTRPARAENSAAMKLACVACEGKGRLYIVHTSAGSTIENVISKYPDLLSGRIMFETAMHYLLLDRSIYETEKGALYLMAPPLRGKEESRLLKDSFGKISCIGTDHCSFMKKDKPSSGKVKDLPKGIGSLQRSFQAAYTLFGEEAISRFTENPARIFNLEKKGRIQQGYQADLVIYDDRVSDIVSGGFSRSDIESYEGMEMKGRVERTILAGKTAYDGERIMQVKGRFLRR